MNKIFSKAMTKFNFQQNLKSVAIFYICYIGGMLLFYITGAVLISTGADDNFNFAGMSIAQMIFIFVTGLASYKETFYFGLANSVSRKQIFTSFFLGIIPICGIVAVIEAVSTAILSPFMNIGTLYSLYKLNGGNTLSSIVAIPHNVIFGAFFSFFMFLFAASLGYFITSLFYKLSKIGKIVVSCSAGALFLFGVPILSGSPVGMKIMEKVGEIFMTMCGIVGEVNKPYYAIISFIVLSVIFAAAAYLLDRRAVVKESN